MANSGFKANHVPTSIGICEFRRQRADSGTLGNGDISWSIMSRGFPRKDGRAELGEKKKAV